MTSAEDKEMASKSESKKHSRSHKDEHHSSRRDKDKSRRKRSHRRSPERERSRSPERDRSRTPVSSSPERHRKSKRSRSRSPQKERPYKEERKERSDEFSPDVCHCLGVFGLSSFTDEKDLKDVFGAYGEIENICIIYDRQSGSSKGFGFVYFKSVTAAIEAKKGTQGLVLDNRSIRVDFSLTTGPHPPTPGRYLGQRHPDDRRLSGRGDRGDYRRAGYSVHDFERYERYERDRYSVYHRDDEYRDDYRDCYSGSGRSSRRYSPYSRRH